MLLSNTNPRDSKNVSITLDPIVIDDTIHNSLNKQNSSQVSVIDLNLFNFLFIVDSPTNRMKGNSERQRYHLTFIKFLGGKYSQAVIESFATAELLWQSKYQSSIVHLLY